jgi:hypothetical protein
MSLRRFPRVRRAAWLDKGIEPVQEVADQRVESVRALPQPAPVMAIEELEREPPAKLERRVSRPPKRAASLAGEAELVDDARKVLEWDGGGSQHLPGTRAALSQRPASLDQRNTGDARAQQARSKRRSAPASRITARGKVTLCSASSSRRARRRTRGRPSQKRTTESRAGCSMAIRGCSVTFSTC